MVGDQELDTVFKHPLSGTFEGKAHPQLPSLPRNQQATGAFVILCKREKKMPCNFFFLSVKLVMLVMLEYKLISFSFEGNLRIYLYLQYR